MIVCGCIDYGPREIRHRFKKWTFRREAPPWRELMDCNQCKHKLVCLIDPDCSKRFEQRAV